MYHIIKTYKCIGATVGGTPGTRLGNIVPSCEIAIIDKKKMCVEGVRNREKKSDRRPDGERMCRTLWWSILDPNSLALSFLPPISHLGLSISQPVGQRKYQSLRTLIPLMRCYELGRRERERRKERSGAGNQETETLEERKQASERERERERDRGREGGRKLSSCCLGIGATQFLSGRPEASRSTSVCVSADGQHCDILLLCGACSRGGGLCPKAQPAR